MLFVLKVKPVLSSIILISEVLEITISISALSVSTPLTVLRSSITALPTNFVLKLFSSEILPATPPTWNVLNVNCVPGSPID